jgi:hypothetical protein
VNKTKVILEPTDGRKIGKKKDTFAKVQQSITQCRKDRLEGTTPIHSGGWSPVM